MSLVDLSNELAIGIDIGGTNTKFGLVNHRGQILTQGDIPTDKTPDIEDYIEDLFNALQPEIVKAGNKPVRGIGVALRMATIIQVRSTTLPTFRGEVLCHWQNSSVTVSTCPAH